MNQPEEWRAVVGWSDYLISDHGRVMSRKHGRTRILQAFLNGRDNYPYPSVSLRQGGIRRIRTVHSLVAEAFIGPRPDGLQVRHIDGDRFNSKASNLAFGSHADNMQDRLAHGRHPMATKTHCKRDHEFTLDNTYLYRGGRSCRACKRLRETNAALRAANVPTAVAA